MPFLEICFCTMRWAWWWKHRDLGAPGREGGIGLPPIVPGARAGAGAIKQPPELTGRKPRRRPNLPEAQ
eukprot:1513362-Pyramimonas_sp.AAC.1